MLLILLSSPLRAGDEGTSVAAGTLYNLYLERLNDDRGKAMEYAEEYMRKIGDAGQWTEEDGRVCDDLADYYGAELFQFSKSEQWRLKAMDIYGSLGNDSLVAASEARLAGLYYNQYKYHLALKYAVSSLRYFEEVDDGKSALPVYNILGAVYYMCGDMASAQDYMNRYEELAVELRDSVAMALALNNLAILYSADDTASAHDFLEEAIRICSSTGDTAKLCRIYLNAASIYMAEGNMDAADSCMRSAHSMLIDIDLKGFYHYLKASMLYAYGDPEAAADTVDMAVDIYSHGEFYTAMQLCYLLSNDIYTSLGDTLRAYEALSKYYDVEKEISKVNAVMDLFKYQTELIKQGERERILERARHRALVISGGLLLFMLILLTLYVRLRRSQRLVRQREDELESCRIEREKYEQDMHSKAESLELEKMHKFRTSRLTMEISSKLHELGREAHEPEVRKKIKEICGVIDEIEEEKPWQSVSKYIPDLDHDLMNRLLSHYPNLTVNERRLCALLNMNLSTKEISDITRQSVQSINTARTRLRAKLGLKGENMTIQEFLSQLH
ncbi:MAG TPA: tetratricopeptide repeat protein [Candidatus Coprenecus pullistercoris]|nr:tetratricopeptide repeat protein [Candidatus Coprenecus pullistercoris]